MSIKNFHQMKDLFDSNSDIKKRLYLTFSKIDNGIKLYKYLKIMITKYKMKNDKQMYERLQKNYRQYLEADKNYEIEKRSYLMYRGLNRANNIINITNALKIKSINNYLDIGTGNGIIAESIGKKFNLDPKNIHCIDVESCVIDRIGKCNFQMYDGVNIPFKKNSMDLITLFMVLHHVKEIDQLLKSIYNVLSKNGILIIREHDANSTELKTLIDVQHALYSILHIGQEYDYFRRTYYGNYYSKKELEQKLINVGFIEKKVNHGIRFNKNPLNYYYSIWGK